MQRGTGAYVSPFDYRDKIAASAVLGIGAPTPIAGLPLLFKTDLGTMLDQAGTPSCVSHNCTYLIRRYFFKKTGVWLNLSPRFLDIMAKRFDGLDRATAGTFPRLVLKIAATYGIPTTDVLPNDTSLPILQYRDDSLITPAVLANAAQHKIPGFISIPNDPVSLRNAIYLYEALTSVFIIGPELWTPSELPQDIDPLHAPNGNDVMEGHELASIGWDNPTLNLGQNQWGTAWDLQGLFHYDPVAWKPFMFEHWAIAAVPADVTAFLKQLPSPTNFAYNWQRNLSRGDFNVDVGMVQAAYMILGYLQPIAAAEFGNFGAKTAAANFAFQTANGIPPVANSVGPLTRGALNKKFAL